MTDIFALFDKIKSPAAPSGPVTHLVVGLGNPGAPYEGTRHNIGFRALDVLAARTGTAVKSAKFSALVGDAVIGGVHTLLMKPQTYMNLSGEAVARAAAFYKIPPANILIICDDVSFDVGHLRIRRNGSHGGHNGLRSIEEKLASRDYPRIKLGVGKKPHPEYDLADWVLGHFPAEANETLADTCARAADAIELMLVGRTEEAMNRFST